MLQILNSEIYHVRNKTQTIIKNYTFSALWIALNQNANLFILKCVMLI